MPLLLPHLPARAVVVILVWINGWREQFMNFGDIKFFKDWVDKATVWRGQPNRPFNIQAGHQGVWQSFAIALMP